MTTLEYSICKRGHTRIKGKECKECQRIRNAEYRARDPEFHRQRCHQWRENLSEERRAQILEIARIRTRAWVNKNPERAAENKRRTNRNEAARRRRNAWKKRNPEMVAKDNVARRTRKEQAKPAWNNNLKMRVMYRTAAILSQLMKRQFHVDHIYPLRSKYMCGLHVHNNLQILPAAENINKSNRRWPGQLPCQREV